MRWLIGVAVAGCSFRPPSASGDDALPPGDAPPGADASTDAFHGFSSRYNLGGPSYTASSGTNAGVWVADTSVLAGGICTGTPANGTMAAFTAPPGTIKINGTSDLPLYNKLILGDPIACTVPSVPNGHYDVRLLFTELYRGGLPCQGIVGSRRIAIVIQGQVVEGDLDVIAAGGGCAASTQTINGTGHVFDRTYHAAVANGQLSITIAKGAQTDFAILSAIELDQMDGDD